MNIRRILAPTDFSAQSNFAVREALELATMYGASVCLLHVHVLPIATRDTDEADSIDALERDAAHRLDAELREAQGRARGAVAIDRELVIGSPALSIVEGAVRWNADLIVMGSHGRSALPRLLLGSVAETVARTALCPVWVVPTHLHRVVRTECERFSSAAPDRAVLAHSRDR